MVGLLGTYHHTLLAHYSFWLHVIQDGNPNGLPLPPGLKGYPLIVNLC